MLCVFAEFQPGRAPSADCIQLWLSPLSAPWTDYTALQPVRSLHPPPHTRAAVTWSSTYTVGWVLLPPRHDSTCPADGRWCLPVCVAGSSAFLSDVRRYAEQKEQFESNQAAVATLSATHPSTESTEGTGDLIKLEMEADGCLAVVSQASINAAERLSEATSVLTSDGLSVCVCPFALCGCRQCLLLTHILPWLHDVPLSRRSQLHAWAQSPLAHSACLPLLELLTALTQCLWLLSVDCRSVCLLAISEGLDAALDPCERCLLSFPLLLSENQDLMCAGLEYVRRVDSETRHVVPAYRSWLAVCVRVGERLIECSSLFGRLPILNDSRARASTAEELRWLALNSDLWRLRDTTS